MTISTKVSEPSSERSILEAVGLASAAGDYLQAIDLAQTGLEHYPASFQLKHQYVLELCRSGALKHGQEYLQSTFTESERARPEALALLAKIAKDLASELVSGPVRDAAFIDSGHAYESIFNSTGDTYAAINAASVYLMGRRVNKAKVLAQACLSEMEKVNDYYGHATIAEAYLVLGDTELAMEHFTRATAAANADVASRASTRRQLQTLVSTSAISQEVGELMTSCLPMPIVVCFCGQMANAEGGVASLSAAATVEIQSQLKQAIDREKPHYAYGALAAGSDIIIAEQLLSAGVDLHVILPFPVDQFRKVSVLPYGDSWSARFDACLAQARSVESTCEEQFKDDLSVIRYASEFALGMALLRARRLSTEAVQIAIWDGTAGTRQAHGGTQHSLALWQHHGRRNLIFGAGDELPDSKDIVTGAGSDFGQHAMLFGDMQGFSKLLENQIPGYIEHVLGAFSEVLEEAGETVEFANTWGDGLYVVCPTASDALIIAQRLQRKIASLDADTTDLPGDHVLRLGGHYGPVLRAHDPVLNRDNFFGVHVSRAARIEPITPAGAIYVSQAFAARLALEGTSGFAAEYVGIVPAAKDYGAMPMYVIKARGVKPAQVSL